MNKINKAIEKQLEERKKYCIHNLDEYTLNELIDILVATTNTFKNCNYKENIIKIRDIDKEQLIDIIIYASCLWKRG